MEASRSSEELAAIVARLAGRTPLLANMVEGGRTPLADADSLARLGYKVVIFPGGLVRAVARTMTDYFGSLRQHGTNAAFGDRMLAFDELGSLVGTGDHLRTACRCEG